MRNLEIERLGLAAMALGIARRSIEVRACAGVACVHVWGVLHCSQRHSLAAGRLAAACWRLLPPHLIAASYAPDGCPLLQVMNKYAAERVAFGQPINRYGQIQRHIADSYAEYAAGRAYVYNTARSLDLSKAGSRIDSDGVKLYCSVMGTTVANRAMQVRRGQKLLPGRVASA